MSVGEHAVNFLVSFIYKLSACGLLVGPISSVRIHKSSHWRDDNIIEFCILESHHTNVIHLREEIKHWFIYQIGGGQEHRANTTKLGYPS